MLSCDKRDNLVEKHCVITTSSTDSVEMLLAVKKAKSFRFSFHFSHSLDFQRDPTHLLLLLAHVLMSHCSHSSASTSLIATNSRSSFTKLFIIHYDFHRPLWNKGVCSQEAWTLMPRCAESPQTQRTCSSPTSGPWMLLHGGSEMLFAWLRRGSLLPWWRYESHVSHGSPCCCCTSHSTRGRQRSLHL